MSPNEPNLDDYYDTPDPPAGTPVAAEFAPPDHSKFARPEPESASTKRPVEKLKPADAPIVETSKAAAVIGHTTRLRWLLITLLSSLLVAGLVNSLTSTITATFGADLQKGIDELLALAAGTVPTSSKLVIYVLLMALPMVIGVMLAKRQSLVLYRGFSDVKIVFGILAALCLLVYEIYFPATVLTDANYWLLTSASTAVLLWLIDRTWADNGTVQQTLIALYTKLGVAVMVGAWALGARLRAESVQRRIAPGSRIEATTPPEIKTFLAAMTISSEPRRGGRFSLSRVLLWSFVIFWPVHYGADAIEWCRTHAVLKKQQLVKDGSKSFFVLPDSARFDAVPSPMQMLTPGEEGVDGREAALYDYVCSKPAGLYPAVKFCEVQWRAQGRENLATAPVASSPAR